MSLRSSEPSKRAAAPPGEAGQEADRHDYRGASSTRVLAANLRSLGVGQVVTRLAGFAVVIVLARSLGEADFGRYTVAVGVVGILALVIQLGMGGYLVREGARAPDLLNRLLGHVLVLRTVLGVLAVLVAAALGVLLGYDRITLTVLVVLAVAAVVRELANSYQAVLLALERARDAAALQAGQAVAIAAGPLLAVVLGGGVVTVALATLAGAAITLPWSWRRLRRQWGERARIELTGIRTTLAVSAVFAASHGLHSVLTYLDSVMVHGFLGNVETGLYGAAYRVLLGVFLVPAVYMDATTRMISRLAHTDRGRMVEVYSRAVAHMTMVGVALGAGGAILAGPILELLYDEPYLRATGALAILLPGAIFAVPMWMTAMTAYALGLQNRVAITWGLAVLANAVANLFLIPRFGIEGAAAASVAAEAFAMVAVTVMLRRAGVRANLLESFGKPLVAGAMMCAAVWPLRELPLPIPIAAGAAAFLLGLLLLRAFGPDDRALLRALTRWRATAGF